LVLSVCGQVAERAIRLRSDMSVPI
jgi:hypothetical protein